MAFCTASSKHQGKPEVSQYACSENVTTRSAGLAGRKEDSVEDITTAGNGT
jgi:hypothetical protein